MSSDGVSEEHDALDINRATQRQRFKLYLRLLLHLQPRILRNSKRCETVRTVGMSKKRKQPSSLTNLNKLETGKKRDKSDSQDLVYVCFLRAINVAGKNTLPMKPLRELLAEDFLYVQTYIQSGNLVLKRDNCDEEEVKKIVKERILQKFSLNVEVFVRTLYQLECLVEENPFPEITDQTKLHVSFLSSNPSEKTLEHLYQVDWGEERFKLANSHEIMYLSLPNGVGGAQLNNTKLEKTIGSPSTMRNWRSLLNILELARSI